MESKLSLKIKENQTFIFAIIITILFSLIIVFLISANTGSNKEMKELKKIGEKFNKVNLSFNKNINDLSINSYDTINTLSNSIDQLKEIPVHLSSINPRYENTIRIKFELEKAISNTITLYEHSIYMINNPEKFASDENISELNSYKDDCLSTYNTLSEKGINISFSEETLSFFDNIRNYINALIKSNKTQNIINSQKRDFINSLKALIPNLNTLTEDLEPALNKIKEDKRDIQVLITDLENKEEIFKDVQSKSSLTSIPDGYDDYYNSLDEFSKLYEAYLSSFKSALIFDKSYINQIEKSKDIANNYNNVFSKYQDVLASYLKFKELLNDL